MDGVVNIMKEEWLGLGDSVLGMYSWVEDGAAPQEKELSKKVSSGHAGWFQGTHQPPQRICPGGCWIGKLICKRENWTAIKAFRATDVTFCQFGSGGLQCGPGLMDSLGPSTCHICGMTGPAPGAGHRVKSQAFLKELSFE